MSSNNFFGSANNNIKNLFEFSNKDTNEQRNKENNIEKNFSKINEFKINPNADKNIITGDRFIPLKNNLDNNVQNFILNTSVITFNQNVDSMSSSEGKIEKNYVNFIIDNMLKISADNFIVKNNEIQKNKIFSFSKRVFHSISKNKLINKIDDNDETNTNKSISLNLSEKIKKYENDANYNYNKSKIIFEDNIYNNINDFYTKKEKNFLSQEKNYQSQFPNSIRKISKSPFRVLDAPNLVDDYYLNLLDWGKENIIAIALFDEIYLWNDNNSKASLLMSYSNNDATSDDSLNNIISSVSWMQNGLNLGIGLPNGSIQLWDINKKMKLRDIDAHDKRVSCISWNNYVLSSGSKDKYIKNFDIRMKNSEISKIKKHKQEVCALKYSNEGDLLASGGNDNIAYIWDIRNLKNNIFNFLFSNDRANNNYEIKPYCINNLHQAAVKAMNWCPWKRHVLATGGGSKDKSIKIYSCDNNKLIKNINTGSQVCSLIWNEKEKEIISSHGHMNRVLFMAKSPDERFLCSGSGDETLRFWKINDEKKDNKKIKEEDEMINNVLVH